MNTQDLHIEKSHIAKLLAAANADAALLYIYLHSGNPMDSAESALHMSNSRLSIAAATLRQLGLWQEEKQRIVVSGERPNYSERDVIRAMDTDTVTGMAITTAIRTARKKFWPVPVPAW